MKPGMTLKTTDYTGSLADPDLTLGPEQDHYAYWMKQDQDILIQLLT